MTLLERVRFRHHSVEGQINPATYPSRRELAGTGNPPVWQDACAAIFTKTGELVAISFWGFCTLPITIHTFQSVGASSMAQTPAKVLLCAFAQICLSLATEMALSWSFARPDGKPLSICAYVRIMKNHWKGLIGLAGLRLMTTLVLMLAMLTIALAYGLAPSSSSLPAKKNLAELRRTLAMGSIDGFLLGPQHLLSGFIGDVSRTMPSHLWGKDSPFSDALKWKMYQHVGRFITLGFSPGEKNTSARLLWLGLIVSAAALGCMEMVINIRINEMALVMPVRTARRFNVAFKGVIGFGAANISASLLTVLGISIPLMTSSLIVQELVAHSRGAGLYVDLAQWISSVVAVLIGALVVMLRTLYMNALWRRLAAG